jgi:hypothetical protein
MLAGAWTAQAQAPALTEQALVPLAQAQAPREQALELPTLAAVAAVVVTTVTPR